MFKLKSILKVYLCSKSKVYLKYTSFGQKSRSINEVLLKYKQHIFLFFLFLYFIYTYFQQVYFKHTSVGLQGSEV